MRTDFKFNLNGTSPLTLAFEIHPTPAVCGVPTIEALKKIKHIELHDRALYAGIIGVVDEENANLYVNLRCAQFTQGKAHLYVGGGLTSQSDPEAEWEETERKALTLINEMTAIEA